MGGLGGRVSLYIVLGSLILKSSLAKVHLQLVALISSRAGELGLSDVWVSL